MEYLRYNHWRSFLWRMARNSENTHHSKYVIRIVCEGNKTEPLFFTSLCDIYCKDRDAMDVKTVPQPFIPEEEGPLDTSRGTYRGKRRKVKAGNKPTEEVVITGPPPLNWVRYARQLLSEGVNESWAVYDKDNHPKHEEAFLEANRIIDGKKVNIAFSSRSFEYYLLLHFEYIYRCFNETECGEKLHGKKHIFECGTGKIPEKDCDGEVCINGYARKRGYWLETKSSVSTFPLVKDNLVKGMVNACRLREESDSRTSVPIYERNPYTNVDALVGRLIGKATVSFGERFIHKERGSNWSAILNEDGLVIANHKDGYEHFRKGMFCVYDWEARSKTELNQDDFLLQANDTKSLPCNLEQTQVISIQLTPEKEILLLPKILE
ncbi:MAG: RloB family protein [Candidatus Cryptobacteroides sp.]